MAAVTTPDATYHVLADRLAAAIASMQPGDRVASEHEIVARHGVSRITARAALQELERRQLVRRIRGAGTFVALRLDYPISQAQPPSFSEAVRRHGRTPSHRVDDVRTVAANTELRERLVLRPGARVVRVRRRGFIDGDVVSCQTHWLPTDLVPDLRRRLAAHDSLFTTLVEEYGLTPVRFWSRAELDTVPADVAPLLGFEGRPPAWFVESCNRSLTNGRVVELSRSWLRADAFRVRFEHGPADGPIPAPLSPGAPLTADPLPTEPLTAELLGGSPLDAGPSPAHPFAPDPLPGDPR